MTIRLGEGGGFLESEERGVASIVGVMLIILILVTLFAAWWMTAVPGWKREKEAEESGEALLKFSELRSNANLLTLRGFPGFSLTTSINMRGGDIPLLPDAVRHGRLEIKPDDGWVRVTRYWGDGGVTYYPSGSFDVEAADSYYTDDGTANGDPDWYPVKLVDNLTRFDVEFHEETDPRPFDIEKEESYPADSDNEDEDIYIVSNVDNLSLFTVKFWELKYLKIGIQNGPNWWTKFWRRDNDLEISAKPAGGSQESYLIEGYFDENSENYRSTIDLLENKYFLGESVQDASGHDIIYRFVGALHWKYHIAGYHPPVRVQTNLEVDIYDNAGNELWQGQFQEEDSNLKIQVNAYNQSTQTFIIVGYFDEGSENYHATVNLLNPKYDLEESVGGREPFDIEFLSGDEAYGAYDLEGSTQGGMSGGQSESWLYGTGTISYDPQNLYYVSQVLSFESGGVILKQNSGMLMSLSPQVKVSVENGVTEVFAHGFDLTGRNFSGGGAGSIDLEMWFEDQEVFYESDTPKSKALLIEIDTGRMGAWESFWRGVLEKTGLEEGKGFVVEEVKDTLVVAILGLDGGKRDVQLSHLGVTTLGVETRT